jgi:hypothetical protein
MRHCRGKMPEKLSHPDLRKELGVHDAIVQPALPHG